MKKIIVLFCLVLSISAFAQDVTFKDTKHNFGKIKQNVPATYVFTYTNTSAKPLVIETATAGCGCTKPEFSLEPLAKGKSNTIKVTYNAASLGTFTKQVTVKFANLNPPTVLTIEGEVLDPAKPKTKTK